MIFSDNGLGVGAIGDVLMQLMTAKGATLVPCYPRTGIQAWRNLHAEHATRTRPRVKHGETVGVSFDLNRGNSPTKTTDFHARYD